MYLSFIHYQNYILPLYGLKDYFSRKDNSVSITRLDKCKREYDIHLYEFEG